MANEPIEHPMINSPFAESLSHIVLDNGWERNVAQAEEHTHYGDS